jgi:hypothetical protein
MSAHDTAMWIVTALLLATAGVNVWYAHWRRRK